MTTLSRRISTPDELSYHTGGSVAAYGSLVMMFVVGM